MEKNICFKFSVTKTNVNTAAPHDFHWTYGLGKKYRTQIATVYDNL